MPKKVKKAVKYHDLELSVVGLKYRLESEELLKLEELIEDDGILACTLEREPDNEVDPLAIKVVALDPIHRIFNGRHIGYIQRPTNKVLNKLLRKGATIKLCALVFVDAKAGEADLELRLSVPRN